MQGPWALTRYPGTQLVLRYEIKNHPGTIYVVTQATGGACDSTSTT